MAARILAYGGNYEFEYDGVSQNIDLSLIEPKPIHPDYENAVRNEFTYTLPYSKNEIKFKLLTHGDEIKIEKEIKGLQKINKDTQNEVTSRLSQMIISINGLTERKDINDFVNNYFLAKDVREFDTTENPEILEKEKAVQATKDDREKKLQERKDAAAVKKKEADDKRAALLKERADARQKLLDDQKAKRDALLNKKKENK